MSLPDRLAKTILSTRSDAIVSADRDGIIGFWNPGAERLFGYSREEAVSRSLDLIIRERLRKRHWDGYIAGSCRRAKVATARATCSRCRPSARMAPYLGRVHRRAAEE